jgi:hypothetical protein
MEDGLISTIRKGSMTGKFKVHAFKIVAQPENQSSIDEIIDAIGNSEFTGRIRKIGEADIRIEHIEKLEKQNLWFIDFVKFRNINGPAKGSAKKKVVPFDIEEDESFCEETGLIYDPDSGYCVIQYNHNGVRFGSIQQYLSMFNLDEVNIFTLAPKYNEEAMRKFENNKGIKKLTVKIDTRSLSNDDFQAGTSLNGALSIGNETGAETIEIVITASRKKKSFLSDTAAKTIESFRSLALAKPDAIDKLEVSYVDKLESKIHALDLLGQRLEHSFGDIPLSEGLRWSRSDRIKALLRAHQSWRKQLNE